MACSFIGIGSVSNLIKRAIAERELPTFMFWFKWLADQGYTCWKEERQPKRYNLDDTALFHPDDRSRKIYFREIPRKGEKT